MRYLKKYDQNKGWNNKPSYPSVHPPYILVKGDSDGSQPPYYHKLQFSSLSHKWHRDTNVCWRRWLGWKSYSFQRYQTINWERKRRKKSYINIIKFYFLPFCSISSLFYSYMLYHWCKEHPWRMSWSNGRISLFWKIGPIIHPSPATSSCKNWSTISHP